jgi:glycosyltransferase involved in cell wall biosynthesis
MYEESTVNRALPRVTLVTAVFNGERYFRETLASIRAMRYPNLEYIVCDGGSTDGTLEILEANRDIISHLIVGKDKGMYDALAKGFAKGTGEIFGWIGCDDLLMPWCLSTIVTFMDQTPGCQWVTGIPAIIDAESKLVWMAQVVPQYRREWIRRGWYSNVGLGPIQQECTYFTRKLYEQVGGLAQFSEKRYAGDFLLWRRLAEHAELHQIGVLLAGYRIHSSNLSGDGSNYRKEARSVRIPSGKLIGYMYSYFMFLWHRFHRHPRMADRLPKQALHVR